MVYIRFATRSSSVAIQLDLGLDYQLDEDMILYPSAPCFVSNLVGTKPRTTLFPANKTYNTIRPAGFLRKRLKKHVYHGRLSRQLYTNGSTVILDQG